MSPSQHEREYLVTIACSVPSISGETVYYEYAITDRKTPNKDESARVVDWFKREGINARIESIMYLTPKEWATVISAINVLYLEDMK